MTCPAAAPAPRPGGAAAATATAVLVAAGAGAWSWSLGGSLVRVAPLVAVGAVAVLLAAGRLSRRLAGGLLTVWLPPAVWAAGAPADQLLPPAWPSLVARLVAGARGLTTPGSASGPIGDQPWPLAVWLLGAGAVWVAGAALAADRSSSARRQAMAFGLLAAPWIAAVAARHTDQAAWQGAAVLLAGLLWSTARRVALRQALVLGVAAALVSVATAQAVGPRTSWFTPASLFGSAPPFRTLQTDSLTYGPLQGRRSGATMLEVTAAEPALWRMQALDVFVQDLWGVRTRAAPELPQPAARVVEATVKVRGLRNDLVVAPGRVDAVQADGKVRQDPGEAWQLTPAPRQGNTYQVQASLVRATARQLQAAPPPTDAGLSTSIGLYVPDAGAPGNSWRLVEVKVPLFGQPPDPQVTAVLDRSPYGPVAALARQLAAGATTQWEVVARVQRYLLDGDRFRYTTSPPQAGPYPLVDFLLRGHAGYCQHFAGAAALLLRLAGVPARVVVGFATGVPKGDGRFTVRDVDAHAWIEVYFQGHGWVAFNPTPPAAKAAIPRQLDPLALAPAATRGGHHAHDGLGALAASALLAALVTAGIRLVRRRTRRGPIQLGQLLAALVRRSGGHIGISSTLAELGLELARLVGPHTATLAADAERARFAPDPVTPPPRPRIQTARALTRDVGFIRALGVLIGPAATPRPRNRPPWATDRAIRPLPPSGSHPSTHPPVGPSHPPGGPTGIPLPASCRVEARLFEHDRDHDEQQ
jgi:protein-glutamine gamma-glutamyltransferase